MKIIGNIINDSLKIVLEEEDNSFSDFIFSMAWRKAMLGKFKFNYDDVIRFIKAEKSINNLFYEIELGYIFLPNEIDRNGQTFVQTQFYWLISVYSQNKFPGDNYIKDIEKREIKIDAGTGKLIEDKLIQNSPSSP